MASAGSSAGAGGTSGSGGSGGGGAGNPGSGLVKALQDARGGGIRTLVLGLGDIVANPNNGCMAGARCGEDHLQDLANAGVGLGVAVPEEAYSFSRCVMDEGGLKAAYTTGGSAPFYDGATRAELRAGLESILTRIVDGSVP